MEFFSKTDNKQPITDNLKKLTIMKRILFPTDFSEASNNAFVYALKLADAMKAELITLHAYELPQLHMGGMPNTLKDVYDSIELENFENFKDQIPVLRDIAEKHNLSHVKISNILKHGDLIWTIKKVTKEEVKKAYTKIQKKIHPDVSPETSRLSAIVNEAKELVLSDIT